MVFDVAADSYARFMGRFSEPLAAQFAHLAGVHAGQRVLDVGCGPGALTAPSTPRWPSPAPFHISLQPVSTCSLVTERHNPATLA